MNSIVLTSQIKTLATGIGFDPVGITTTGPDEAVLQNLQAWISRGYHSSMAFMARDPEKRVNPRSLLPEARSVIVLGYNYYKPEAESPAPPGFGKISNYAYGRDYHYVINERLQPLVELIEKNGGNTVTCIDSKPVMERQLAERAGLGFIGKNTLLITKKYGSWIFLAEIITDMKLEYDENDGMVNCGTCRKCLDACPTDAFPEPWVLDSGRCISFLTIESKEEHPDELKKKIGDHLFGCDICQTVCPFNKKTVETGEPEFHPDRGTGPLLNLNEILEIQSNSEYKRKFSGSPLARPGKKGLQRNARTVIENENKSRSR